MKNCVAHNQPNCMAIECQENTTVSESPSLTGSAASVSEIPSDWFVSKVDLDAEIPYCEAEPNDFTGMNNPTRFLIPQQLAYYLRQHFCGSKKMKEALIDKGKWAVRSQIKAALDIE